MSKYIATFGVVLALIGATVGMQTCSRAGRDTASTNSPSATSEIPAYRAPAAEAPAQ